MANLSILERNIIHGLDCEYAELVFLRAIDRVGTLVAENIAYRARSIVRWLQWGIGTHPRHKLNDEQSRDLTMFVLRRFWAWSFPDDKGRL